MSMYDAKGNFIGKGGDCCKDKGAMHEGGGCGNHGKAMHGHGHEGCSGEKECHESNAKTCSKGDACCKAKK